MSLKVSRPVLVFDGDCGFCTTCARFLARWVLRGRPVCVAPWQRLDLPELGLTPDRCQAAVQWVGPGGQVASGHGAIAAALGAGHRVWRPLGALLAAPGFSWLAERIYSWIAGHRDALRGGTPACRADSTGPA
ncbi:MAG TPA: DCC1-like thiol-disulfide oxidoreductase family protein [Dermatophilaceae bacterium]